MVVALAILNPDTEITADVSFCLACVVRLGFKYKSQITNKINKKAVEHGWLRGLQSAASIKGERWL